MPTQNVDQYGQPIQTVYAHRNSRAVLVTNSSTITTTTTSADLSVEKFTELSVDFNITALSGTSPSYTLSINRKGLDGVYYPIYNGSAQTAAGKTTLHLGVGATNNVSFGSTIQVVETIAGTNPSITRSLSIQGK